MLCVFSNKLDCGLSKETLANVPNYVGKTFLNNMNRIIISPRLNTQILTIIQIYLKAAEILTLVSLVLLFSSTNSLQKLIKYLIFPNNMLGLM